MADAELVRVMRGGIVDCVHRGYIAVVDTAGYLLYSAGNADTVVYLRSCTKPFQALAVIRSGAAEKYGFTTEELALMAGSHSGTPDHTRIVTGILAKIGVDAGELQCGVGRPLDAKAYEALLLSGGKPSVLQHNCSGKHSGMLAACRAMGWDVATYREWDHPLQVMLREIVGEFAGMPAAEIHLALDGCGVPTFGIPMKNLALMFANLGTAARDDNIDLSVIARAMQQYPIVFSGENRIDSALVIASKGNLIAKGGAEGAIGVSVVDKGVGIALKMTDGSNRGHIPALIALMLAQGHISADEAAELERLQPSAISIHTGQRAGEMLPVL